MPRQINKAQVADAISRSLVEFGYPDCTPAQMTDVIDAYVDGKRGHDLPHDVLGIFAERQLNDLVEIGVDLSMLK